MIFIFTNQCPHDHTCFFHNQFTQFFAILMVRHLNYLHFYTLFIIFIILFIHPSSLAPLFGFLLVLPPLFLNHLPDLGCVGQRIMVLGRPLVQPMYLLPDGSGLAGMWLNLNLAGTRCPYSEN